ncbi:APC family permease [Paenarthrobacter sp. NPDC090517]|uniref:APC family permease n=1 Tax=Paenarthrobacter sp. NPDC090517 TaxID=3364381 RepID=UPI0038162E5A
MSVSGTRGRKLKSWEAAALSIGFMGPLMAVSLNGIGVSSLVGKAVPFVFALGFVGVALVAYGFVRLTGRFNHAGSVYALAGLTIGPRAGFIGGFALLGTYLLFAACTLTACSVFFQAWVVEAGWSFEPSWILLPLAAAVLTVVCNLKESRFTTHLLTYIGGAGVVLMLVLAGVILFKVSTGQAPVETGIDLSVFSPEGVPLDSLMAATVFAFLCWAGFESCASLGEETDNPKRAIPMALGGAVVLCGAIFVFMMFAQTIGFGTSETGVALFAGSESSITALAGMYIGKEYALILAFAAAAVAFASTLSSTAAASRLLFALARDGFGPSVLARVDQKTGVPRPAVVIATVLSLAITVGHWLAGVTAFDTFYWTATIAVLCLLVAYGTTIIGVVVYILSGRGGIPKWEVVIPLLGLGFLMYVYFVQAVGQEPPFSYFPWIAGGWCLVGAAIAIFAPTLARKIGQRLVQQDSLQQDSDAKNPSAPLLGAASSATSNEAGTGQDKL